MVGRSFQLVLFVADACCHRAHVVHGCLSFCCCWRQFGCRYGLLHDAEWGWSVGWLEIEAECAWWLRLQLLNNARVGFLSAQQKDGEGGVCADHLSRGLTTLCAFLPVSGRAMTVPTLTCFSSSSGM